jgi:hypothetical protein
VRKESDMSDSRFDGRKIYEFMSPGQAVYDIRGKYIHKANSASMPKYEIRGNYIHKAHSCFATRVRDQRYAVSESP